MVRESVMKIRDFHLRHVTGSTLSLAHRASAPVYLETKRFKHSRPGRVTVLTQEPNACYPVLLCAFFGKNCLP